jgi:hypothetical protein
METNQDRPAAFFPVSVIGGNLLPAPGPYVREDQLDARLQAQRRTDTKIRSTAELDAALHASKGNTQHAVTLWIMTGLEHDAALCLRGRRQRGRCPQCNANRREAYNAGVRSPSCRMVV